MRKLRKLFYLLVSSTLLLGCKPTPESQTSNTKEIFNLEYVDQKDSDITILHLRKSHLKVQSSFLQKDIQEFYTTEKLAVHGVNALYLF